MPFDVDDIIDTSSDLVVTTGIPQGTISTEVESRVRSIVHIQEFLVVPVYGASHPRPRLADTEVS